MSDFAELLRAPGPWTWAYVDTSEDIHDPVRTTDLRRRSAVEAAERAGASEADAGALRTALADPQGVPSPSARYLLVRGGQIVLDETFSGPLVGPESAGSGPLPDLTPLKRHRGGDIRYLRVDTARDGGELRLQRARRAGDEDQTTVEGRTDTLHKASAGGWAHRRFHEHVEAIWKSNQSEVAAEIDRAVLEHSPAFIVVAGDIKARQLLLEELGEPARAIVVEAGVDSHADGASDAAVDEVIRQELARIEDEELRQALDRLGNDSGRLAEHGVGAVVHALQSAQADLVLVDPIGLGERTLLALDAEPWVATAPEESLGATVLGEVPAATALVYAAELTDADVHFVDPGELPDAQPVAAVLRWPTGPATPGA